MSFLDIKDAKKRDVIVADYLATVKRLQQRNMNEKAQDLLNQEDIERTMKPVIQSTEKSTDAITKELIPIKEEIKVLNDRLERNRANDDIVENHDEKEEDLPNIVQVYYQKVPKDKLDKYFGVIMEGDGRYKMGNKYILIDKGGADFTIDGKKYTGTKGIWSLIMKRKPTDYSEQDLAAYQDIVLRTNVIEHPNNIEPTSRVTTTKKWREIFPLFINENQHHRTTSEHDGEGIFFLPGDIKGLETKLNYLLGEYRAGNRSSGVRNEIVSILDELLRRKKISRKEYQDINIFLK